MRTCEGVGEIPAPDDTSGEECDDEEETVDKLKLGSRHMEFVLPSLAVVVRRL